MDFSYSTPAAFDRAIKKAVKEAGAEPGEGYRQALRDRFLCRVFADGNEAFVLKGGSGLLARIPDANRVENRGVWEEGEEDHHLSQDVGPTKKRPRGKRRWPAPTG